MTGNLLGHMHGAADRGAGGFEIDDRAAAYAARDLLADAENARLVLDAGDEAADFRRADIDCRDDAAARPHRTRPRCRTRRVRRTAIRGTAVRGLAVDNLAISNLAIRSLAIQGRRGTVLRGD